VTAGSRGDDDTAIRIRLAGLRGSANDSAAAATRATLVEMAAERMRGLAHRMLAGAPLVRRWTETDDVVQSALLRLYRALGSMTPHDPEHFVRLAALQVRRELIDLTRRLRNPESFAANHDTNALADGAQRVEQAVAGLSEEPGKIADWTRFHETVDALPPPERELFGMVWYLGLSQDEIADLLGCSARTVRRRWDDAKRAFTAAYRGEPPS